MAQVANEHFALIINRDKDRNEVQDKEHNGNKDTTMEMTTSEVEVNHSLLPMMKSRSLNILHLRLSKEFAHEIANSTA